MPLDLAQPIALYLLMFCALGTVLSSGLFSPGFAIAAMILALGSLAVPLERRKRLAQSRAQGVILVLVFVALAFRVVTGKADVISGATLFLIAVLISRLYTPRGPAEATQILMLSLLVVLAGSALSTSFSFAPYFIGFVVCSVWALTTTQLSKESIGRRSQLRISGRFLLSTSLLALFIFAQTTAFFLFFPRFGVSMLQLKNRPQKGTVGYTDHVDLGTSVDLEPDESVVLRLDFGKDAPPVAPETMYFRGTTLVAFDGVHWLKPDVSLRPLRESGDDLFHLRELRSVTPFGFYQEATDSDAVFLPEITAAFGFSREARLATQVTRVKFFVGSTGEVTSFKPAPMALRFTALYSTADDPREDPPIAAASELPADTNPELRALATKWAGEATSAREKVAAISHQLAQYQYTTTLHAPPAGRDPLSYFLFDSKAGHCEYFASSMAVLLRAQGVPSRLVNGYFGATLNQYGHYYSVAESRAHTWVEYWDEGWHRIDPTSSDTAAERPSRLTQLTDLMRYRWSRYVVDFDLDLQVQGLQAAKHFFSKPAPSLPFTGADATRWLGAHRTNMGLVCVLALLSWLYWLRSRYIYAKVTAPTRLYRSFEKLMRRRGVTPRERHEGPLHFASTIARMQPQLAADAERFTNAYVAARFGGELSAVPAMRSALKRLERTKVALHSDHR